MIVEAIRNGETTAVELQNKKVELVKVMETMPAADPMSITTYLELEKEQALTLREEHKQNLAKHPPIPIAGLPDSFTLERSAEAAELNLRAMDGYVSGRQLDENEKTALAGKIKQIAEQMDDASPGHAALLRYAEKVLEPSS